MLNPGPPQPPPMPGSLPRPSSNGEHDQSEPVDQTSSLAVQLQAARLKRTNKVSFFAIKFCVKFNIYFYLLNFKAASN